MRTYLAASLCLVPALACASVSVPSPQALWKEIQQLQKAHAIMPESTPYQIGSRTVDPYTTDLANAAAIRSIQQSGGILKVKRYENDSLVVKENYNSHKRLVGVTAMLKLKGYDAGDRNWVMAAYKPSGAVAAFGKIGSCIACHVLVRQQDFVFAPPPAQMLPISTWKAFFPKQGINPAYVAMIKKYPDRVVQ